MFCENCGNQLHEEDRFCQKCGARVPEQGELPVYSNSGGTERQRPGNSGGRGKVIAAVSVAAVLLIAAAAAVFLFVLPGGQEEEAAEKTAEEKVQKEDDSSRDDVLEAEEDPGMQIGEGAESSREGQTADGGGSTDAVRQYRGTPTGLFKDGVEVYMTDFDISASSVLVMQGYNYEVNNLTDLDTSTCWSEGAPGDGTNETLLYTGETEKPVSGLAILPGYTKSKDLYDKNCAPAMIRVECGGRTFNYSFSRSDVSFDGGNMLDNMIYIDFGETILADECKVTITDVSGGSMEDCCISEMFLYS